jgi:hypothetical protein
MASTLRALVCISLIAMSCGAQNVTVPAALNGLEGGSATSIPFGTNQPVRVQYVYDAEELPWTGPRAITRVSLRADNADPGVTTFLQKGYVFVTMLLSTTSLRAGETTATYADNYGADAMVVLDNVPMLLPAQPAVMGARAANIDFVLPQPWAYGMTPMRPNVPAPRNLLVELRIHSQPTGVYRIDNVGSCSSAPVQFGSLGPACASSGLQLQLQPGASLLAGSTFTWTIRNVVPNGPTLLFVATQQQPLLFGAPALPIPVPLFDATNPLSPNAALAQIAPELRYGAPDCFINVQPEVSLFALADAAGNAAMSVSLPADRGLVGASVYAQAVGYSQTANPMQIVTSIGQQSTVCGPLGVARIYNFGSITATSGQRSLGQGAVLEFY